MPDSQPPLRPRRRRALRVALLSIAAILLLYLAGAIHFLLTPSGLEREYYAELNARFDSYPESERAWHTHIEVANNWTEHASELDAKIGRFFGERGGFDEDGNELTNPFTSDESPFGIPPDHEFYSELVALIESFEPDLARLRAAARLPVAGMPTTDNWAENGFLHPVEPLPPTPDLRDRPPVFGLDYKIGPYRSVLDLLAFEAFVAADRAEAEPVIDNIRAIIGIARHTHEQPGLMGKLIALRYLSIADQTVGKIIERRTAFMTDSQLAQLQVLLADAAVRHTPIDLTDEIMIQQEILDRTFTKNARGDGLISFDGLEFSLSRESGNAPPPVVLTAMWPIRHRFMDRAYHQSQFDQMTTYALDFQTRGPASYPDLIQATTRLTQGELTDKRVLWRYSLLLHPYASAAAATHTTRTRLGATATRLALERYKLAHNHYPDTLGQLVPTYLPELPADPFNSGHPLKYLLRDAKPYIYSVGSNGIDNQATPAPPGTKPSDLEARFADPNAPAPTAPAADWILSPPQD